MRKGNPDIAAMLGMVLGLPGKSAEELYFATKKFDADPKTADAFGKIREELAKINPDDVDSFVVTVVHRRSADAPPEPCPGCGEIHENQGLMNVAGIAGEGTALMAQISLLVDKTGLVDPNSPF